MATMFRAVPKSDWAHPNVMATREAAERYLDGLVDGGTVEQIDVDATPLSACRVERSYAGEQQVLLITEDVLAATIADCQNWDDVTAALNDLRAKHGADKVGVLLQYLGTDGKLHIERWLDGCGIQPAKKIKAEFHYAALTVATKSGYKVSAVKHSVIG